MKKRIINREFFERKAEVVARDLLGKFICCENDEQEYQIIETEAYYHDEKDEHGKYFCYGVKKDTGENSKTCATIPLFRNPGTWCIYGGQLLLSVTSNKFPDNVLIKQVKAPNGKTYKTDDIAKKLRLYQKDSKSNYWDFHGLDSLSIEAGLYLTEGQNVPPNTIINKRRVNINNAQEYNFSLMENN